MMTDTVLGGKALQESAIERRTTTLTLVFDPTTKHVNADMEVGDLSYVGVKDFTQFIGAIRHRDWIFCLEKSTSVNMAIGGFHANVHYTFIVFNEIPLEKACALFSRWCAVTIREYLWNPPTRISK